MSESLLEEVKRALCEIATLRLENRRLWTAIKSHDRECSPECWSVEEEVYAIRALDGAPTGDSVPCSDTEHQADGEVKPCPSCDGSGAMYGGHPGESCRSCNGTGRLDGEVKQ
jgi:hypothetical protein